MSSLPARSDGGRSDGLRDDHGHSDDSRLVVRFDRVERVAHQLNGLLFAILMLTALALYFEPLMALIGRRNLVEKLHLYSGIVLPLPLLVSALGYWGRGFRADVARLDRWSSDDRTWLRVSLAHAQRREAVRAGLRLGKFNAGQKFNAAFTAGAILVMLGTGLIMYFYHPWPLAWRTGATFVHDWLAVAIAIVVVGHIRFALRDPDALRAIWRGTVSRGWARRHAPEWLEELDGSDSPQRSADGQPLTSLERTAHPMAQQAVPRSETPRRF